MKKICPWYFDILAIISERLNLTPVGLGNSSTPINIAIFTKEPASGRSSPLSIFDDDDDDGSSGNRSDKNPNPADTFDIDDLSDDDLPATDQILAKHKHPQTNAQNTSKPKQGLKEAKSDKAMKPVAMRKGFNPMDRFAEITKAEQETAQEKLKLRRS